MLKKYFFIAAICNKTDGIKLILSKGIEINAKDENGCTVLMLGNDV